MGSQFTEEEGKEIEGISGFSLFKQWIMKQKIIIHFELIGQLDHFIYSPDIYCHLSIITQL